MNILLAATLLVCAEAPQDKNAVTQREIDRAIAKGLDYLKTAPSPGGHLKTHCDELILLTMIHGGLAENHKDFERVLKSCLNSPLEHTYKVALLAMSLEELDPSGYQNKIAQCAQFLVDNQCTNGQWSYGRPTEAVKLIPFEEPKKKVASTTKPDGARDFGPALRTHPKPSRQIPIKPTRQGGASGDNSNSQYAALGLRACHDANIKLPEDVLHLARKWWVESQHPDEGEAKAGKDAVASGDFAKIQGWNYQSPNADGAKPTHAMTAGAVGATVIYEYMLGRDWKKDKVTLAGVNWMGKHYSINSNLYYMYALERAGMLFGTDKFGGHDWYLQGAKSIVHAQKADGSWGSRENADENTWDTCFAILFLKKATKAIATGGGKR